MLAPGFYNMDCMEGMKQFPDKYFELAIVDPPYGDGGGGGVLRTGEIRRTVRPVPMDGFHGKTYGGGYGTNGTSPTGSEKGNVHRTGGTWAEKFGKKSFRGTQPRTSRILMSCSVFHRTRLSGGAITLNFRQPDVS